MDAHYIDWLHLLVRWLHVIAGVAWIGASFYFNWLEGNLNRQHPPSSGLAGDLWAVHGGGFYHVVKYQVAPPSLPKTLHWFKWEAYTTWLSGFALLAIVYYLGANAFLIDPQVAALTPQSAIFISLACLVGSWITYDLLCRSPLGRKPLAFTAVLFSLLVALAYALCHLFSSRGAYIHVGAVMGTLMAGNVWRVIIPSQKVLVEAMRQGQTPDPALGQRSLQRSLHNNYLTLPVLFIMISNHFPMTYGHRLNWLVLAIIMAAGALTRHYFNLKNHGERKVWILPVASLAILAMALVTRTPSLLPERPVMGGATDLATAPAADFEAVSAIIHSRCTSCHSAQPTDDTFRAAPNGVMFDSTAQIKARAALIKSRVVDARTMPLANKTAMTDDERTVIARWFHEGAPVF